MRFGRRPPVDDEEKDDLDGEEMEFLDHLEELRVRLLRMIVYVIAAAIICVAIAGGSIIELVMQPIIRALPDANGQMIITKPFEAMVTWLKINALAGVVIAMPFVGFELWGFVAPALSRRERGVASTVVLACPGLFIAGAMFIYYVFPLALAFLLSFVPMFPETTPMLNPKDTIGMMLTLMLGMGIVFQMPVVVAALAKFGMVTGRGLISVWRYAIVVIMIVAAVLTPTWDPVNLGIVAGPMVILYFASAGIATLIERSDRKREELRRAKVAEREREELEAYYAEHGEDDEPEEDEDLDDPDDMDDPEADEAHPLDDMSEPPPEPPPADGYYPLLDDPTSGTDEPTDQPDQEGTDDDAPPSDQINTD